MHTIVEDVDSLSPLSILDVGVGFGKWGFLFREALDVKRGRLGREDWDVVIDGVEVFEQYIQPHQRFLYDTIHVGDICELVSTLGTYDLVFMSDVLEHIDKLDALCLLDELRDKCRWFALVVPMGDNWYTRNKRDHDNEREMHISMWHPADFGSPDVEVSVGAEFGPYTYYRFAGRVDGGRT